MAKLGFINNDVNKVQCIQCKIGVKFKENLNFSQDEVKAKQWYNRVKKAHMPDCIFKSTDDDTSINQAKFPHSEFATR